MANLFHFVGTRKYFSTFLLLIFALLLGVTAAVAQSKASITGKVLDDKTKSVAVGATVRVTGSAQGVIVGADGAFSFSVPSLPVSIEASLIGYRTLELDIYEAPTEPILIYLVEDLNVLSEVVVVGYGTQKRNEITGALASVPTASLQQASATSSFDNLLSGAVAGVQVTQSSGQPGASSSIRIRGGNSITGGNEPLYVIDGQIMYNNNAATSVGVGYSGAGLNALATINPADIESIEVLKDASATAIYGSRGANGVILVSTKKGSGRDKITYAGSTGQSVVSKKLDLLNAKEWALLRNDIITSDVGLTSSTPFTQEEIDAFGEGSDWQDAALRTAWTQNHQLSISGGDDKTKYFASGNYYDKQGVVLNSSFERYALRTSVQREVNKRLKTALNLSVSSSMQAGVSVTPNINAADAYLNALLTSPVVPIYEADGSYHFDDTYVLDLNSIANLTDVTNETKVNRTFGSFSAEYKIIPELTAKVNAGADLINAKQNFYAPSYTVGGLNTNGYSFIGSKFTRSWQTELTLTYDKTFSDSHHLTALTGYTVENTHAESARATATNFLNDITGYNDLGSGSPSQPASGAVTSALSSWLGRVSYSYKSRYNATASFRADGSSRFAPNYKWGYFPSLGLSWNISEEEFLKDLSALSSLKLRLSAGSIGNQEIGDYQYFSRYSPVIYSFGRQLINGYAPVNIANNNLKWETTTQYNAGLDVSLLKDRISVIADAYYKLTSDLLVAVPIPTSSGHAQGLKNVGNVSNKGVELTVAAHVVSGRKPNSFSWHTILTFAHNQNRVESLGDDVDFYTPSVPNQNIGRFNPLIVKEGYALGTFWGYETNGIVQLGDDVAAIPTPSWTTGVQPGDRRYVDHGGAPNVINDDDRVLLGSAQPKLTFGFTNTFSYKSFDLLALVQGSYGNKLYNALRSQLEITSTISNVLGEFRDRWTPTNPSKDIPRATNVPNTVVSDRLIEDASYLRLKSATLGYSFPKSWTGRAKIEKLRLFVSGQNLLTLTGYSGYDPEANTYEQNSLYQGIDFGAYPSSKSWLAGVEITF